MAPVEWLDGEPVAAPIRETVADRVRRLGERGVTPTLATVLASDDPADERFVALKHEACATVGIASRDVRLEPAAPGRRVESAVGRLSGDPSVHGVFVQVPLPDHVDEAAIRDRVDRGKDVDCFHVENLGRLVTGAPRFVPATPAAVRRILDHYGIPTAGRHVTVVGRSSVIGRPLANLLWRRGAGGDATVTVCHSRTRELGTKTRAADIVVTAAGQPGLVDGSMLAEGVVVIDVSANRLPGGGSVVGDVDQESAAAVARAMTPVPGGVGPATVAMLLENVVLAAERQARVDDRTDGPHA